MRKDITVFKSNIIPQNPIYIGSRKELDFEAICVFLAIGFFLDQDTYYKGQQIIRPATTYTFDKEGAIQMEAPWFQWHYSPRDISLKQTVSEFTELFETIVSEQIGEQKVILPLSGGLDSRTQAAALKRLGKRVHAYGYSFQGGHDETGYGEQIARKCNFPFEKWEVLPGYLWNCIEQLGKINECYSEFTHPRQMAFIDRYVPLGDVFNLGHLGDLLFDDMGVADDLPFEQQVQVMLKKIVKQGGIELASALWHRWGLVGNFSDYLYERVKQLLTDIHIPNSANARIRAFKSIHWVPRWTNVNLSIFESVRPITLPYYDNRMCEFICTVPEKHLAKRQIQIEYLKLRSPELARIPWQEQRPFNLYNYHWNQAPFNWPYRGWSKFKRTLSKKKLIQRNWELQFLGKENDQHLQYHLFENTAFSSAVPKEVLQKFYKNFKEIDVVKYSHPVSMLLTLSLFFNQQAEKLKSTEA